MKTIEETYVMLSQQEHILKRPDTYIGSVNKQTTEDWVFDKETEKIVKKIVDLTPGFIKIFDEILTNAVDHSIRDSTVTKIKVEISQESGEIVVSNDGSGIPVVIHAEHQVYIPELVFGNFLSGSNYDDTETRNVAGRNGLGAKLSVLFSKIFKIETVDSVNKKKFLQTFTDNMSIKSKAKVSDNTGKPYTKISFIPDYQKFEMSGLDDDTYSLLTRRVYECIASTNKSVSIYFNGVKIKGKGILDYSKFFFDKAPIASEVNSDWEYVVYQNQGYDQVSFVNGNNTVSGGKHVDYILNQITSSLKSSIETKAKLENLKVATIKENLFIFLNAVVPNPKFSSQTKDLLTTPIKDFKRDIKVTPNFIKKIFNSPITQEVIDFTSFREKRKMDKNVSVSKKSSISVKNLDDATNAGTNKSKDCSLILTEGLSASSFAIAGLSVVGRANYGVFSLRGKLLNVREATQAQLLKNEEILNVKKIMGLHGSKKYNTSEELASLRYGNIIILADADVDGVHISSLIMNFIHHWWPELLKIKGFIRTIKTPIVKVSKGKESVKFYDEHEYEKFMKTKNGNWTSKYYKGLGTSTSSEAKETFKEMDKTLEFYISDSKLDSSFRLAFDKKKADDRKKWLEYVPNEHASRNQNKEITYSDFINKELIHFSNYDNIRSIPHLMDGLKPSQRKVLYTAFKRNLVKEMKVAQFGAAVAEETAYHHGEASLSMTIVNMAQDYTGSNNINLLEPCGNFGFRNHNGKDAASPRYIFTHLTKDALSLFSKDDENILDYNFDDSTKIEPKFYIPSIPMILVNGSIGIGTGYSTNIPSFNPVDIKENIKLILTGKSPNELIPWYKGFKGTISKISDTSFIMKGVMERISKKEIVISEIPISISISDYKDFLETFEDFTVVNGSTENHAKFTLKIKNDRNFTYEEMKLLSKINISNMHLFDAKNKIKKYTDPNDIIIDFLECKMEYTQKRKDYLLSHYKNHLVFLNNKKRFLEDIIENRIDIYRKKKSAIDEILAKNDYTMIKDSFNYLTSLSISSFTKENLTGLSKEMETVKMKSTELSNKTIKDIILQELKE